METKAAITATRCADNPPKWRAVATRSPWFFGDPDRQVALRAELESWRGTRFAEATGGRARKGVSCDCVSFAEGVLVNLGAIEPIKWPAYVTHGGGEAMLKLLQDTLETIENFWCIAWALSDQMTLLPGDVFLISSGKALHHLAIYAGDNTLWHATHRGGVCTVSLFDPMAQKHTKAVYRVRV